MKVASFRQGAVDVRRSLPPVSEMGRATVSVSVPSLVVLVVMEREEGAYQVIYPPLSGAPPQSSSHGARRHAPVRRTGGAWLRASWCLEPWRAAAFVSLLIPLLLNPGKIARKEENVHLDEYFGGALRRSNSPAPLALPPPLCAFFSG